MSIEDEFDFNGIEHMNLVPENLRNLDDIDLNEGPLIMENDPITLGIRLLEDDEPEAQDGFVIEIAMWLMTDDENERDHVASAFVDESGNNIRVEVSDPEGDENLEKAGHCFMLWVQQFMEFSQMFERLDGDLSAWKDADPNDIFGGTEPAEDPTEQILEEWDGEDDHQANIFKVMAEFGLDPSLDIFDQVKEMNDVDRQKLYVQLKRMRGDYDG